MAVPQLALVLQHINKLAIGRFPSQHTDRQLLEEFEARRDEAAFGALVARHGEMVLRVCRRVLHHEQDAEDAFQATFLVLGTGTKQLPWIRVAGYDPRGLGKAVRSLAWKLMHRTWNA